MRTPRPLRAGTLLLLGYGSSFVPPLAASRDPVGQITAVFSDASDDYARTRLADGSFQPETYAFGNGGLYRAPVSDPTIDDMSFMDIARTIAGPLATQNYVPTKDPNKAKLLIMVYWGMTSGTNDPSSSNFQFSIYSHTRSGLGGVGMSFDHWGPVSFEGGLVDNENAGILGYGPELMADSPRIGLIHNVTREDLIDDIEHNRYFVVLMAYDFQMMWKQRRHKQLWETRFSMRQQGNDFARVLPAVAQYASQYFGEATHGRLIREPLPEGKVEVGAPRPVGVDSGESDPISKTTLIADPGILSPRSADGSPDLSALPAELAARVTAYQRERTDLQTALAAAIKAQAPGEGIRRAIDAFNSENGARIAALSREAESIRSELAKFAEANSRPVAGQPVENLVRQFNDSVREIETAEPMYTHP